MVDAGDLEAPRADIEPIARTKVQAPRRVVADERLPTPPRDHDQALRRKAARLQAEDEHAVVAVHRGDEELERCGVLHARARAHAPGERVREQRAGEVDDAALEEAEVGAADVDQVVRRPSDARGDRQERDDQPDADRDPRRRQRAPRGPPEQVPQDEAGERHGWIFALRATAPSARARTLVP